MMPVSNSPVIRRFEIEKLHGYKNVVIDFENSVKIIIAENGAGKTTILTALDAFLRADFGTLRNIEFDKISCLLHGMDSPLVLERNDLYTMSAISESVHEFIESIDIEESVFSRFITQEFDPTNKESLRSNSYIYNAYLETNYSWDDLWKKCNEASEVYKTILNNQTKTIIRVLHEKLGDYEILYLPTYRRIEKPQKNRRPQRHMEPYVRAKRRILQDISKINYGLEDVENRLEEISEDIQKRTNYGYRQISAQIIEDLLFMPSLQSDQNELPDFETLKIFFTRIGRDTLLDEVRQKRIEEIYSSPEDNEKSSLRYFLGKLANVVNETSQVEKAIKTFVDKVNGYLGMSSDSKTLTYDPVQMKVSVQNDWTGTDVKFDDLSSGEKQAISLLSYLFLFHAKKIILIDEPELSLSMEWQQKILTDITSSPLCSQLLAITHSPFIFDNDLDPYASPLNITREKIKKEAGI